MNISNDRRVRKTKKALEKALASLLMEKPLKNITVREISDLADISRGTFYLHYSDIYDMVEKIQNEIYEKFNNILLCYMPQNDTKSLFPMLTKLFELLSDNSDLAKCLIGKNGDAEFVHKLKLLMKDVCFNDAYNILNIPLTNEFNYYYEFIAWGCIGLCASWLNNGMKDSPETMAYLAEKFILNGLNSIK